jgi:glucoamylase
MLVGRAAGFIVRNGPVTQQDRWEEDAGYSPFTLAVEISGLLAAADLADAVGQKSTATFLRETADCWNDNVEDWTYAKGTDLARQLEVEGYYVRIAPPEGDDAASPLQGFVPIKNSPPGRDEQQAVQIISPDALALVRFGLRAPNDPRILNTIKVIDALLKVQLPQGPCWYRYNGDGYGEHEDGSPFDGTGIGRPWPLLAGERAHYELAAGHPKIAEQLLRIMEFSTEGGRLIPEQVWDAPDIPVRELFTGKPSGSACPLVWAHSEYIKLRRSLRDGRIFDQPPQPIQRYQIEKRASRHWDWRFNNKRRTMPRGKQLRISLLSPALVHWSFDGWQTAQDSRTQDTGLGMYVVDLPSEQLAAGKDVVFTLYWQQEQRWEGVNFSVRVDGK